VVDGATGEIQVAQIFVAVLGASSFIYAEATWSQTLPDWIAAHVNALAAIGGVPRQIVSDNLKSGISKASFYEPTVNRTYAEMATHYGTAIVPARRQRRFSLKANRNRSRSRAWPGLAGRGGPKGRWPVSSSK